ncbi:MAG: PepSY domain-containing protein [Nitrospirae bacterium]|nr:PepSY domain-containing protein [Nitrospirota bacterium]
MKRAAGSLVTAFVLMMGLYGHDGSVLASEKDSKELEDVSDSEKIQWARATKVSVIEAIKVATAHTAGQVIEAALHSINGRLLYEIEVVTNDGKVVEVYVDPQTGKLIQLGDKK